MLVAVDAPAGLAWGSSLPGALLPLEWATPRAITAASSLPIEWGETFRGSAAPLEWGAAGRGAAGLLLDTSVRAQPAEFVAPAEIASRQTAVADAASPAEWGGQTRLRAPLPGAARRGTAVAVEAPVEATGSAVIAADRPLPFEAVAAARAVITAAVSAELNSRISPDPGPRIETLEWRDFGIAASIAELLSAGRRDAGTPAEILAGMGIHNTSGPEFLAAMLLDPAFAGEVAARPVVAAAMGSEMLARLLRDALVPTNGSAKSGRAVAARSLVRIEWRQKKVRIRRLLASSGRRRVLGPVGPDGGRS